MQKFISQVSLCSMISAQIYDCVYTFLHTSKNLQFKFLHITQPGVWRQVLWEALRSILLRWMFVLLQKIGSQEYRLLLYM